MAITTCIFDAYGTLFDVTAAARQAAAQPGQERLSPKWQDVARDWRQKQLQYSWLRAVMGRHADFWQVTSDGLDWALAANGLAGDAALRRTLLDLYWTLSAYDEVPEMLARLKGAGYATAILSNGSPEMLAGAVSSAGLNDLLDDCLSVEDVQVFKPARVVYDLVGSRFDTSPEQVLFVSSNGWDAAAASEYGFKTAWVNRNQEPTDRLPWVPDHELTDLRPIPDLASKA